jgi:hypothetical protein
MMPNRPEDIVCKQIERLLQQGPGVPFASHPQVNRMASFFDPQLVESCLRHSAAIISIAIAFFLFWLVTIIDIVTSEFRNSADKIIWFFFVMMFAPIGVPLYFFRPVSKEYGLRNKRPVPGCRS